MRRCSSWFLFALIAIATPTFAATTVTTFTISGTPVSWTTATASVFIAIDRDPLNTGDITVDLTADADLRFSCIHCTIPAGQTTVADSKLIALHLTCSLITTMILGLLMSNKMDLFTNGPGRRQEIPRIQM